MFLARHFTSIKMHVGHKANKWNAKNAMYLRLALRSTHIIDLEQTIPMMRRALTFVRQVCDKRGKISWVGVVAAGPLGRPATPGANAKQTLRHRHAMIQRTEALRTIPEALFLLNIKQNLPLLRNSIKLQIPVIGVINSDADPLGIQYPIPANDAEHLGIYKDLALGAFEECTQSEPKLMCGPAKP